MRTFFFLSSVKRKKKHKKAPLSLDLTLKGPAMCKTDLVSVSQRPRKSWGECILFPCFFYLHSYISGHLPSTLWAHWMSPIPNTHQHLSQISMSNQSQMFVGSSLLYHFHSLLNMWKVKDQFFFLFFFAGRCKQMVKYVFRKKIILQGFSTTPLSSK